MINPLYRWAADILSPSSNRSKLSVLIYHRVLTEIDELLPYETTAETLDKQMAMVSRVFNVLPLGESVARLQSRTLPPRALSISFDDGYANHASVALPILKSHGLPAIFFIASAYLNGGRMFNDTVIHAVRNNHSGHLDLTELGLTNYDTGTLSGKRQTIANITNQIKYLKLKQREAVTNKLLDLATDAPAPNDLMMTSAEVKQLHDAGMEIGAHTARHPILTRHSLAEVKAEIAEGRDDLESIIGQKVDLFAYPNGKSGLDYHKGHIDILKKMGFKAAVTTNHGAADGHCDLYQIPRYTPHDNISMFTPRLLRNLI